MEDHNYLQRMLEETGPPQWVTDMHEHYERTRTYRPEDLRRLLGDPTRCVTVGPGGGIPDDWLKDIDDKL